FVLNDIPSSKILSRAFADKTQALIQSTGTRPMCFGMILFDNVSEPNLYYVDSSAVCLPYKGIGVGDSSNRINKFLESKGDFCNFNMKDLEETALEAFAESIGQDYGPNDVIVGVLDKGKEMRYMETEEVDAILLRISEKN
ncbi:hypothetical protein EDEG_03992, partial [Edhazardia aedis USNM 41457]